MQNYFTMNPSVSFEREFSKTMSRVYLYMSIGMLITAGCALGVYSSPWLTALILGTPLYLVLIIAELILVVAFSSQIGKMSLGASAACLLIYSALNGATLSSVFIVYELGSIASVFLVTCLMFGGMSLFGYVTKVNLTKAGYICVMAIWGLIIAGVVNIFLRSSMMNLIFNCAGVAIFVILTAADTQKIKKWLEAATDENQIKTISMMGSLLLYLNFINIFIRLLAIFGKRK